MAAGERTEKATPKKRDETRKKGQVAKSADLNGAVVLMAAMVALAAAGPSMASALRDFMAEVFRAISYPRALEGPGLRRILEHAGLAALRAAWPVVLTCVIAGVLVNVAQVRLRITPAAIKPDPKKLNPISGAKNLFGVRGLQETVKSILKVGVVAAIVALDVYPRMKDIAGLTGAPPQVLAARIVDDVRAIFWRGGAAYLVIGLLDYGFQRWRFEKGLRMDKEEVKQEYKQQNAPAEVKAAQRRRALQAARARMMAAVPQADVVVTNPTHYAVALKYDPLQPAPEVLAKGIDLVAARIREIAREHDVPVVPDPPLARALYAGVEVGHQIPEELFQAVARVLAFVYRMANRRRAA